MKRLLIVEDTVLGSLEPSEFWVDQSAAQHTPAMLDSSLPHRDPSERVTLSNGILGVTTWRAACAATNVDYASLPDLL